MIFASFYGKEILLAETAPESHTRLLTVIRGSAILRVATLREGLPELRFGGLFSFADDYPSVVAGCSAKWLCRVILNGSP
jgi:hypothetical protein